MSATHVARKVNNSVLLFSLQRKLLQFPGMVQFCKTRRGTPRSRASLVLCLKLSGRYQSHTMSSRLTVLAWFTIYDRNTSVLLNVFAFSGGNMLTNTGPSMTFMSTSGESYAV